MKINNTIVLITLIVSCFQLNAQQSSQFEIELLNQIHIDYLIDMGLNVEVAKKINRGELISQELFKSLLLDTPFMKKHPEKINQLGEMSVEMNGEFAFDDLVYDYSFSSLKNSINYQSKTGKFSGEFVTAESSKAFWLPGVLGLECIAGISLCHLNCRANCDATHTTVLNSTCYLCGGFSDCTCRSAIDDPFGG